MSEREYKRVTQQLRPFITLFIVVVGSAFLASCGGAGNGSGDTTATVSSSDAPNVTAQAVSGNAIVPGGWVGRKPVTVVPRPSLNGLPAVKPVTKTEIFEGSRIAAREILIAANRGVTYEQLRAAIAPFGWKLISNSGRSYQVDVSASSLSLADILDQADSVPEIAGATVNPIIVTNGSTLDPIVDSNTDWHITEAKFDSAWKILPKSPGGDGLIIGIIDGGFKFGHEDLTIDAVVTATETKTTTGSFGTPCKEPPALTALEDQECEDSNHGMNVAGIIAAKANNNVGSAGVAHPINPKIYAYSTTISTASIPDAVNFLTKSGAKIINLSMGSDVCKFQLADGCIRKSIGYYERYLVWFVNVIEDDVANGDVLFVQAAGNDGRTHFTDGTRITYQHSGFFALVASGQYRGKLTASAKQIADKIAERTIIVGAHKKGRTMAVYSNIPSTETDANFVVAPGGVGSGAYYYDTEFSNSEFAKGNIYGAAYSGKNRYVGMGGTSQAAPHVAGLAALIKYSYPDATPSIIKGIIIGTAETNLGIPFVSKVSGDGSDGYRYLNAEAAVKEAIRLKNLKSLNGHQYEVVTCGTWSDCRDVAVKLGGQLVTIRSQAENDWLMSTFGASEFYWIGASFDGSANAWKWLSGEPFTFSNWGSNLNNSGGNEYCAHFFVPTPGYWNDVQCGYPGSTKAIVEYGPSASVVQWKPSDPNVPWRNDGHIVGGWWTYSDIPYSGYVQIVRMRLPTSMRIGDLSIAFKLRGSGANVDAHMIVGNDLPTTSDSTNMYPYYAFYTVLGGGSVVERDINLAVAPTEIMGNASCPNDNVAYCNQDKLVNYVVFHFRDSKDIDYLRVRSKGQLVLNLDF